MVPDGIVSPVRLIRTEKTTLGSQRLHVTKASGAVMPPALDGFKQSKYCDVYVR